MTTWKKVERGFYVTADGRYGVQVDGYAPSKSVGAEVDRYEGFQGGEWAAIVDPAGRDETLDWYPTMREARERCEHHAETGA